MKKLVTLLFIAITNISFGQDTDLIKKFDKLESLVNKQTSSTIDLRLEEKKLVNRIDKLIEVYDSVSRKNILKNEELENKISSNETNIDSIRNKKPDKKQNSCTDWIKAIAALFTVFVALPAALLSIFNFYSQKIKRLNELEEYFKVVIQGLYKPIENQASSLLALSKNLSDINIEEARLKNEPSLNFENIDNIDKSDLHKIFVLNRKGDKKNKIENFTELESALNRVRFIKNSLLTNYQNCFQQLNSYLSYWNQNWSEILKYRLDKMQEAYEKQNNNDEFLLEIGKIYDDFRSINNNDKLKIRQSKFIVPLHQLCLDYFKLDSKANYVLSLTSECNSAFNGIKKTSKDFKKLFRKNHDDLLKDKSTIEKSLENILKIKRLSICRLLFS